MGNKKTILAIDDNEAQLHIYYLQLCEKYEVRLAESVAEALAILVKEVPDVILLDIEMPGVNGFEFLTHIKENIKIDTPIIIVSSNNDDEFYKKALDTSAFEVLTKPTEMDGLIKVIEKALSITG